MNENNRRMLEENELNHNGHLDYLEDTISNIKRIVEKYPTRNSIEFEKELVQLIINAR